MIIYTKEQLEEISRDVNLLKQSSIDTCGFVFEQLKNVNMSPEKDIMMNSLNIFSISYLLDNYELSKEDKVKLLPFFASSSNHSIIEESTSTDESIISFLKEKKPLYRSTILDYDVFCSHTEEIKHQFELDEYSMSEILVKSAKTWGYKKISKISKSILFDMPFFFEALTPGELNTPEIKPLFKEYLLTVLKNGYGVTYNDIIDYWFEQEDRELLEKFLESTNDNPRKSISYAQIQSLNGADKLISKIDYFEKYKVLDFTGWSKEDLKEKKLYIQSCIKRHFSTEKKRRSQIESLFQIEGAMADELSIVMDANFLKELLVSGSFYISSGSDRDDTEYVEKQTVFAILMSEIMSNSDLFEGFSSSLLQDIYYYISSAKKIRTGKLEDEEAQRLKGNFDLFFKNVFAKSVPEGFSYFSDLEYLANTYAAESLIENTKKFPSFNKIYACCVLVSELNARSYDNSWGVRAVTQRFEEELKNFSKVLKKQEYELLRSNFSNSSRKFVSFPSKSAISISKMGKVFSAKDRELAIRLEEDNVLNISYDYLIKRISEIFEETVVRKAHDENSVDGNHEEVVFDPYNSRNNSALKTFKWLLSFDKNFEKKVLKSLLFNDKSSSIKEDVLLGIYSIIIRNVEPTTKVGSVIKDLILKDKDKCLNNQNLNSEIIKTESWLLQIFDQEDLKKNAAQIFEKLILKEKLLIDLKIKSHNLKAKRNDIFNVFEDDFKIVISKYGSECNTFQGLVEKYESKIEQFSDEKVKAQLKSLLSNLVSLTYEDEENSEKISLTEKELEDLNSSISSFFIKDKVEELLKNKDFENLLILLKSSLGRNIKVLLPLIENSFNLYSREELLEVVKDKFWRNIVLELNNTVRYDDTKSNFKFKLSSVEEYKDFLDLILFQLKETSDFKFLTKELWPDYVVGKNLNKEKAYYVFNLLDDSDPNVQIAIKQYAIENFLKQVLYSYDLFYTTEPRYKKVPINEPYTNEEVLKIFKDGVRTGAIVNMFDVNARVYEWIDANYRLEHGSNCEIESQKRKKDFEDLVRQSLEIPMLHAVLCSSNILRSFAAKDERFENLKGDEAQSLYCDAFFDKKVLIEGVEQWLDYSKSRQDAFDKLKNSENLKSRNNNDSPHELDTNVELVKGVVNQVIWASYYDKKDDSGVTKYYSSWSNEETIAFADVLLKKAPGIFLGLHCLGNLSDFSKSISEHLINNKFEQPLVEKILCFKDESKNYGLSGRFGEYYDAHLSSLLLHCLKHQEKNQIQYIKSLCDNYSFIEESRIGFNLNDDEERRQKIKLREFSEQIEFATNNEKFMQMLNSISEVFKIESEVASIKKEEQRQKKVKSLRL